MTDTTTAIVWFRRDLRLADNPALHAAINDYDHIIALYIDDRADDGDWRQGAASDWWLHHSLAALSESIEKRGGALVVRQGNAADVLDTLIKSQDIDAIYWNRLYDPAAIKRDKAIKQSLTEREITAKSFNGALLIEPWEVETQTETPYRVFTPFWREAQKRLNLGDRLPTPKKIKSPKVDSATLKSLDLLPSIRWDKGIEAAWVPGEAAAAEKAAGFVKDGAQHYDEQRDFPGIEGVSRLSPHLHFGEISVRQLWENIVDEHGRLDDGSTIYRSELGWREFSHHILYHYPHTADEPMKEKYAAFPWRDNADDMIKAWQRGRTGIPIVDAGMRELWQTGWMHNRVRMIVGSFLVKNIRAHWLHGAKWFWDTLVDADLPANSMGWQWAAGSGADAAPYFRIFNPQTQGEKFDKQGDYVRHYVPELSRLPNKYLHHPWDLPENLSRELGFEIGKDYPEPIVDLSVSRKEALAALQELKELS